MKKRLFSLIMCLIFIIPCGFILTACGKAKPKSISVSGAVTEFLYQDEFTFGENAKVEIEMSKGDNIKYDTKNLVYNAETKTAETDNYKIDYSAYNGNVLGEYEIKVIYKNDTSLTCTYKVKVVARPFTDTDVTATDYSGVYDGAEHSIAVSCVIDGAEITYSIDGVTYTAENPSFVTAGEYVVYFKIDKENYAPPVTGTKTVNIAKKELTLTWGSTTFTYDKQEQVPSCEISGLVGTDECSVIVTGGETNVGTYIATASAVSNENYKLPAENTKEYVINAKKISKPAIDGLSVFVYNTEEQSLTLTGDIEEGAVASGTNSGVNAGRYTYTITLENANYVWEDDTTAQVVLNWEIQKKPIDVPVVTGEFTYNSVAQGALITGFDSSIMTKTGTEKSTNAGVYTLKFNLIDTLNYYWSEDDIAILAGEKTKIWTIAKVSVDATDVVWNYQAPFTYDGTEKSVALLGLPSGFTPIYENATKTNAGTYTATVTFIYDAINYNPLIIEELGWSIQKINPTYTVPASVSAEMSDGLTLADVSLDAYAGFSWENGETLVNASGLYRAIYTPSDTVNYNQVGVDIYVNLLDPAKSNFTSYTYSGEANTSKDIAISSVEVVYDGEVHGVLVCVDSTYASGNASDATITYNGAGANPAYSEPGEYTIQVKVSKDGYNDFVCVLTLTINKKQPEVQENPEAIIEGMITIDDTLADLKLEGGSVICDGENIPGEWAWENSDQQLIIGTNSYKAVFKPTDSEHYSVIEVELSITAELGNPLKTFKIDEVTYSVDKNESSKIVDVELEYGKSANVDFSAIYSGYKIFNEGIELSTMFVIESLTANYDLEYAFYIGTSEYETIQTIIIRVIEPTHLEAVIIKYSEGNDIKSVDLKLANSAQITGNIIEIDVVPETGYTATTYINDILLESSITTAEISVGINKVLVVVKNSDGEIVKYYTAQFDYVLSEEIGAKQVASVLGQSLEDDVIYIDTLGTNSVSFVTDIDTDLYPITLYRMNLQSGAYTAVSLGSNSITNGANIFKAVLAVANSAKVVREFVIFGNNDGESYNTAVDDNRISNFQIVVEGDNYSYQFELRYFSEITVGLNFDVSNITVVGLTGAQSATITEITNKYILVKISDRGDYYYKIIKIDNGYNIVDNNADAKILVASVDGIMKPIEDDLLIADVYSSIYVKTINPNATVSIDNSNLVYMMGQFFALKTLENELVTIRVTATDGEAYQEYTLTVTFNAVKVIGITPVISDGNEEVRGEELKADIINIHFETEGELKVDMNSMTISALDTYSNYTIYNAEGNVWADGDGDRYIKVDVDAEDFYIYADSEFTNEITNLNGVLLKLTEENGVGCAMFFMYGGEYFAYCVAITLVETLITNSITLAVKSGTETLQEFEIEIKTDGAGIVSGDYYYRQEELELSVGSFEGSSELYYVDNELNVYSYVDGMIGEDVLGTLNYGEETYYLNEKTIDSLENVELNTEFTFATEEIICFSYFLEPNAELEEYINSLDGESLTISVEKVGDFDLYEMIYSEAMPEYEAITSDISSFNMDGVECVGIKLVYNAGTYNEFSILLQGIFVGSSDLIIAV